MRQRFRSTTQNKSEVSPEQGLDFCIFINTFKNKFLGDLMHLSTWELLEQNSIMAGGCL